MAPAIRKPGAEQAGETSEAARSFGAGAYREPAVLALPVTFLYVTPRAVQPVLLNVEPGVS